MNQLIYCRWVQLNLIELIQLVQITLVQQKYLRQIEPHLLCGNPIHDCFKFI